MADTDDLEDLGPTNPITMEEWAAYVQTLEGSDLRDAAVGAGSIKFGEKLLSEGYPPEDVTGIRTMFALRFLELEEAPPTRVGGCVIDYRSLLPGQFTF